MQPDDDLPYGRHFGAKRFETFKSLYPAQRRAAEDIITGIHQIACASRADAVARERKFSDETDRPHNVFLIDGERGTGKTSVLLTIHGFVAAMLFDQSRSDGRGANATYDRDLVALKLQVPSTVQGSRNVGLVLPIVFTEDLELHESTMEAVLALMDSTLQQNIARTNEPAEKRRLQDLLSKLRKEVGVAWTYSRKIGGEAMFADALDYEDFVNRRAKYNAVAYDRIRKWRLFVDEFLDAVNYELLVLTFDDSDLDSNTAADIVGSIRMYFSHPRVVSVIAAEMESLLAGLLSRNIAKHSDFLRIGSTTVSGLRLDRTLVDTEASNTFALVDKVFPPAMRKRLRFAELGQIGEFFKSEENEVGDAFLEWCRSRHGEGGDGRVGASWQLLSSTYRYLLAGNVRRVVNFREQTKRPGSDPVAALLTYDLFHTLYAETGGNPDELRSFIERQLSAEDVLAADSVLKADEIGLVDFWIDSLVAAFGLDTSTARLLTKWLPDLATSLDLEIRVAESDTTIGFASVFGDRPLPRNCVFLHRYRMISNAFAEGVQGHSPWVEYLFEAIDIDPDFFTSAIGRLSFDEASLTATMQVIDGSKRLVSTNGRDVGMSRALAIVHRASHAGQVAQEPVPTSDYSTSGFSGFVRRLSMAASEAEKARQLALLEWSSALAIAKGSREIGRATPPRPVQLPISSLAPSTNRSRFSELVALTLEEINGTAAEGHEWSEKLLLVWSVIPCLEALYDYGSDHGRKDLVSPAWRSLLKGLADFSKMPLAHEDRFELPGLRADDLQRIHSDVVSEIDRLVRVVDPPKAGGTPPDFTDFWTREPSSRLAALLGSSERWASHLVT